MNHRKLRMGMVGGGIGAFIGGVHRMAAALDGEIELVAGAFSSDPSRSRQSGEALYLPAERVYGTFQEMLDRERERSAGDRIDFVSIVTPNHVHFAPAKAALEAGFDVICDKPVTFSLDEAEALVEIVEKSGRTFALTHNYTGYPMVKQARQMVREGELGNIRRVVVEYPQGWLSERIETTQGGSSKQASWRTDPKRSGKAGCMGDIGTHAENLAEYVTGLRITEVCADLTTFVEGRRLEDDGNVLLRYNNGARGVLFASQIAAGEENNLRLRVYGEKAGLDWSQMEPNTLVVRRLDQPAQLYRTGADRAYLGADAQSATRIPAGHPEGYLEAFAVIYRNFARTVRKRLDGETPTEHDLDFPTVADGLRGMHFIETVLFSNEQERKWVKFGEHDANHG